MTKRTISFSWQRYHPHSYNRRDKPGRWTATARDDDISELWSFLYVDLEYELGRIEEAIDNLNKAINGSIEPGDIDGGNDGVLAYGGGHVMITSVYADDQRVVMTADQCLILLEQVRGVMQHPDYRNPDREPFPPFEIETISTGEDAVNEYWRRGGITPRMPDPPPS